MQEIHECPECGAKFATAQELQEHLERDHIGTETGVEGAFGGESQRVCPACSAEFPSDESLEEHRRQAHPSESTVV